MVVRDDCFWHRSFRDYNDFTDAFEIMHECELAEPLTCPCDWDCDWYISTEGVKAHIYNLLLDKREQKEK